jgi:predicted nuclease of predicted toxin-antitoxin system
VDALRQAGYEVDYIAEIAPGADDSDVLARANRQESVLITGDKDFGELVYRGGQQKSEKDVIAPGQCNVAEK